MTSPPVSSGSWQSFHGELNKARGRSVGLFSLRGKNMKFTISIFHDEDGMFIAECPTIPGCVSQGQTEQEARENVQKAIKECLEVRAEKGML